MNILRPENQYQLDIAMKNHSNFSLDFSKFKGKTVTIESTKRNFRIQEINANNLWVDSFVIKSHIIVQKLSFNHANIQSISLGYSTINTIDIVNLTNNNFAMGHCVFQEVLQHYTTADITFLTKLQTLPIKSISTSLVNTSIFKPNSKLEDFTDTPHSLEYWAKLIYYLKHKKLPRKKLHPNLNWLCYLSDKTAKMQVTKILESRLIEQQ